MSSLSSAPAPNTSKLTVNQPAGTGAAVASQPPIKKVLVVGDWIFDEHWVTGTHRSATSSRVGHQHLRALHAHDNALYGLCGAAETASILCRATHANSRPFHVLGAGVWDTKDREALWTMLNLPLQPAGESKDRRQDSYQSPFRITRDFQPHLQNAESRLFNIASIIEDSPENKEKKVRCGTMRVVRLYRYTGAELELLTRIDWEPQIPDGKTSWIPSDDEDKKKGDKKTDEEKTSLLGKLESGLRDFLKQNGGVDAIVLQDMHKGGISKGLVSCLKKLVKESKESVGHDTEWFISTKAWRPAPRRTGIEKEEPDWLSDLKDMRVRLLLIPQPAAKRIVQEGGMSCWITKKGVPSNDALTMINGLSERFEEASIVVLPDSFSILARDRSSDNLDELCIVQTNKQEPDSQYDDDESGGVGLSLTSVLFPSIVAQMLCNKNAPLQSILPPALNFTNDRMKEETERIKHPETENPELPREHLQLAPLPTDSACQQLSVKSPRFNEATHVKWDLIQSEWKQSFKESGILYNHGPTRIEPWRAMTEVDGYVCCVPSKLDAIRQILRQVAAFRDDDPHQHRSLMMVAPPGAGKTHLVKQLAKAHDFSLLRFNITQMLSKKDILDCFDAIATTQNKDKHLLVFIDEINALLDSQHVYDAFLAPIEEGVYVRGGMTFHIDPCLWLFAGTEDPKKHRDKSGKGSDFVSRLSIQPVLFKPEAGEEAALSTERAYLGACLLSRNYREVRTISERVLQAFEFLRPDVEKREIEKFVKSFSDIQYAQVTSKNVPMEIFKDLTHQHCSHPHYWTNWEKEVEKSEGLMVEICA